MYPYTPEQLDFINFTGDDSVILSAVAGSGKTQSAVGRLKKMLADGVNPSRIIFFSFTNDAVDELKSRVDNDRVRITTIHSYTSSQLGKMNMFKPIASFYEFANWYKEKYRPKHYDPPAKKVKYQKIINSFYEDSAQISSSFSAFKLQTSDGGKVYRPDHYDQYVEFLYETSSRDFSDLLIETERLSRNPQFQQYFVGTYDYVFIDEYQDTSTLQLKILLNVKAKQYFLIGDKNQSIYGFSGANCDAIEALLKKEKQVRTFNLTTNFRSHKNIVAHSNKFSALQAVPHSAEDGLVETNLIQEHQMFEMIEDDQPLTILCRTNAVIKELEMECLRERIPLRYFNFLTPQDIKLIKENKINGSIKKKLDKVASYHSCPIGDYTRLLNFIEKHQGANTFITSIHKSKGREYPRVLVVNSFDPSQLQDRPDLLEDYSYVLKNGDIDVEAKNIHYVACSRPREEIYYLLYEL